MNTKTLRLGVLVSGRGSNMEAIIKAGEEGKLNAKVVVVISDRSEAPALKKAERKNIKSLYVNPKQFSTKAEYEEELIKIFSSFEVDLIILAGFMRLLSPRFLSYYKNKVLNIHPSLLPSFPGLEPQKQAIDYGVKVSGCTVHFVDEGMDTGPIILQRAVPVLEDDDAESLAERILKEEHDLYWRAIQLIAEGRVTIEGRKVILK
ncbi:MAG TPA: phosphoribosylglycinamide formyltransferase [Clostridia bacterium]|jgi:phosphoribosylglycinamide formyltransferase-1|nr:phosphoribosylglycinamide formyltransferase [Clostridia bacterium]